MHMQVLLALTYIDVLFLTDPRGRSSCETHVHAIWLRKRNSGVSKLGPGGPVSCRV